MFIDGSRIIRVEGFLMKTIFGTQVRVSLGVIILIIVCFSGLFVNGQTVEQTITLEPGWNAVFLEVQPDPYDPQSLFGGQDIESVWTWAQRLTRVDFVQNPSEGLWNRSGWLVWTPEGRSENITTNLHAIFSGRAYIVHYTGQTPRTLTFSGTPNVEKIRWVADSYNLVGFHLDPDLPPTFGAYFNTATSHSLQTTFRLQPNGQWVAAASGDRMRSGEAFWVFSQGESNFNGPLLVELPGEDGLDYNNRLQRHKIFLKNIGSNGTVTLHLQPGTGEVPLNYREILDNEFKTEVWPEFEGTMDLEAQTNHTLNIELSVDRARLAVHSADSILEIRDNAGSRWLVPVKAQRTSATAFSGLWVGNVRVMAVSESQVGSLVPKPVYRPFSFRIMVHVDAFGQARLLKEVIQMWEDGTYSVINDPDLSPTPLYQVDQPGHYVLITDNSLISNFQGVGQSGGQPVGYRISTAAYDFEGNELNMDGSFDFLRSLTGELILEPNDPTNPFMHKFHPDHNNLDEHFLPLPEGFEEAYRVIRNFQLEFVENDPEGTEAGDGTWMNKPGWGSSIMGGVFRETISGVHKNDIATEGTFRLNLVSTTDSLNSGGTP